MPRSDPLHALHACFTPCSAPLGLLRQCSTGYTTCSYTLRPGDTIVNIEGKVLKFQSDNSHIVVYDSTQDASAQNGGGVVWDSQSGTAQYLVFQDDGNIVAYTNSNG